MGFIIPKSKIVEVINSSTNNAWDGEPTEALVQTVGQIFEQHNIAVDENTKDLIIQSLINVSRTTTANSLVATIKMLQQLGVIDLQ